MKPTPIADSSAPQAEPADPAAPATGDASTPDAGRASRRTLRDALESLSLTNQFRVVVVVSVVVSMLAMHLVTTLFDVWRARQHAIDFALQLPSTVRGDFSTGDLSRLPAVLAGRPEVAAVVVVSPDGEVTSRYVRPGGPYAAENEFGRPQPPEAPRGWFSRVASVFAVTATIVPVGIDAEATAVITLDPSTFWRAAGNGLAETPLALMIGVVIALLAANSLKRNVVDPLIQLAKVTRVGTWAQGAEPPATSSRRNELTEIASNFDQLADRLAEYEREVRNVRLASSRQIVEHTKAVEQRLRSAEAVMRAKDDFLANVSHEIRTPMNGVLGMAELLAGTKLDRRQQRFVDSLRTAAATMMQIINDILDDSKIEAGKMDLVCEPFDVRGVMEDVGQLYAGAAEGKKLELICRIESGVPETVVGDVLRLRQVLSNLVSNAVKYTDHGELQIRVAHDRELEDGRCRLHFSVSDTGPGIPEEQQAAVFDAFTQLENATRVGGTGLGLSIANRLVKLLGGERIELRSEPGHGSTFSFALPFEVRKPSAAGVPRKADFRGLRVLLVDDNSASYLQLEETLMEWSVEVTVVNRARIMLERLKSAAQRGPRFDLVLIDHSLPDITSPEILRAIRTDPLGRSTYVVLLTALAFDPDDTEASIEPDACLGKPVRRDQLERALHAARDPAGAAAAGGPGRARPDAIALGLDVLVADDNAINREVAVAMLEERRCNVASAEDGRAAVNLARARRFDAILMDCQMPVMDGYQAAMVIRHEENQRGVAPTPIVALTANVRAKDRDRCIAAGMTSFLSKPFTPAQLVEALRPIAEARGTLATLPAVEASHGAPEAAARAPVDRRDERVLTETGVVDMLEVPLFEPASRSASGSSLANVPVLDHEQVDAILSLGKPQVFAELCRMFEESAPVALQTIETALAAGDLGTVAETAHALKSSCANLGGRRMAEQLGRCETAAADLGDAARARDAATGLQQNYAALIAALAQVTARRTGTA
jgi:signal transduction histidine kinase/CheY-like chemotaxis protein